MFIRSIEELLAAVPAILLAIGFHEFAHGKAAQWLGDPTPERDGRLTLNPLKHLDPIGTLLFVIVGFGWAKPVQVNPYFFRGDAIRGMMLVGLAGPAANIILAYMAALAFYLPFAGELTPFLSALIMYNVILAVFNLLPVPPLDGSRILAGMVPRSMASQIYKLEMYGPIVLIILLVTGIIGKILWPLITIILSLIFTLSGVNFY